MFRQCSSAFLVANTACYQVRGYLQEPVLDKRNDAHMSGILSFVRDVNVANSCIVAILPSTHRLPSGSNKDPTAVFCIYSVNPVCKSQMWILSAEIEDRITVVISSTIVPFTNLCTVMYIRCFRI